MHYEVKDFKLPPKYDWVDTSAPQFNYALDQLVNYDNNLLIMGPGGTGKSVLLALTYEMLKFNKNVGIVAPTGVAGANLAKEGIPAVTMHSFFELSNSDLHERKVDIMNEDKIELIRHLDILIFEEISMVNPEVLDLIIFNLMEIRGNLPRMVMFGDVFQLPPVVPMENEFVKDYYNFHYDGGIFFFNSHYWIDHNSEVTCILLDKIYRQANDSFANLLNRIRLGETTYDDLGKINKRLIAPGDFARVNDHMLYLASTNARVDEINAVYDKAFRSNKSYTYSSIGTGTLEYLPREYVTIRVGQQIMCTANNRPEGYQNGTLATVIDVLPEFVVAELSNGKTIRISPHTHNDYRYKYNHVTKSVEIERPGSWTMMACKPAFASTIHKAQGLTLDAVYIDLNWWVPEAGVYLALSRCKTLEGIGLFRPIKFKDIKVNQAALNFYRKMESKSVSID